jgi:cobaltochelatase CobN
MQGTELVLHSRSSNTWGPLSLDHVYEFMGGITLSIRAKTGKDPVGYFNDLRTRGCARATSAVSAVRTEARTTVWNPKFLRGLQREGPSAAGSLSEAVRNMYGWNVMQPGTIDQAMWDETYRVFIEDKHDLAMREYFERKNPYAFQDMTAIMLETARKGYWVPSEEALQNLARVHAALVARFGAACSYETCGNRKLQEYLNAQLVAPSSDVLDAYAASLAAALESARPIPEVEGIQLEEKLEIAENDQPIIEPVQTIALAGCIVLFVVGTLAVGGRRRRKDSTG